MRVRGRPVPPLVIANVVVVLCLLLALVVTRPSGSPGARAPEGEAAAAMSEASLPQRSPPPLPPPPPVPPPAPAASWSGFAFDACRAPSQRVMNRWRTSSPFTGVGVYLGGVHRACKQRHLTAAWVKEQVRTGWNLLPIWVGPQASCTGYRHRITARPGSSRQYPAARARAAGEARNAVRAARGLQLARGSVIFYDMEPFDVRRPHCRGSSLAFLDQWTREIHRLGYRSGVYSHVSSGISLLSRTGRGYARPDAVWYAWIDRVGTMPRKYVADVAFMATSRVHQYALDTRVEFGGFRMDVDWNFVSLGAASRASSPLGCQDAASRLRPEPVLPGANGHIVRVLQCLVLPGQRHPVKTSGRYDPSTVRAVRSFQQRQGLKVTGAMNRQTWTSLLARGGTPVLRRGARGEHVRRLQRSLNVAVGRPAVRVDGSYGPATARTVRYYRTKLGLGRKGVVNDSVWRALGRGRVLPVARR